MWIKELLLVIIGVSAGAVVSGGLFSFIVSLGVVADLADKTHTGNEILLYEDAVTMGGTLGNLVFLYEIAIPGGTIALVILGLFSGIFVGCEIMALAEILNVFPIFVRRVKVIKFVPYIVLSVALGKGIGEFLFAFLEW